LLPFESRAICAGQLLPTAEAGALADGSAETYVYRAVLELGNLAVGIQRRIGQQVGRRFIVAQKLGLAI